MEGIIMKVQSMRIYMEDGCKAGVLTIENSKINRSEERRVGKDCKSKCRSRWSPDH